MASVPEDAVELINNMVRANRQHMRATGREPTLEELAQKLDVPLEKVRSVVDVATVRIRI